MKHIYTHSLTKKQGIRLEYNQRINVYDIFVIRRQKSLMHSRKIVLLLDSGYHIGLIYMHKLAVGRICILFWPILFHTQNVNALAIFIYSNADKSNPGGYQTYS